MQTYMKTEHCIPNKINKLKKIVDVSADDLSLEVVCDWAPVLRVQSEYTSGPT